MDRNELQQQYSQGRENFTGLNLSGLDLSCIYMPWADFTGADFSGTKLTLARLGAANLSGANLVNADITSIDLVEANLSQANLQGVNMSNLRLGEANLEEANLERAILSNIRLAGTNLTGANLSSTDLRRAWLNKVVLRNANLTGADLTGANLQGSDLTGANLTDAKLEGVCWLEVQIDPTLLTEKDALNWRISNHGADNLHGIDLSNVDLRNVSLQNADLSNANFSNANFSNANLLFSNLSGSNLSGTNLSKANLSQANLTNANLTNVNLINARLYKTSFTGANLKDLRHHGTSFFKANLLNAINVPLEILSTSLIPLNHPDINLLNQISGITDKLTCRSEKDDPYEIFIWNVENKGEFTLEKLLRATAHLSPTNIDNLQCACPDTDALTTAYQFILSAIEEHSTDIELLQLETESLGDVSAVKPCLIIGRSLAGDWFGVTTEVKLELEVKTDAIFHINDESLVKAENQELISILEKVAPEANKFLPRNDSTEKIVWAITENRDDTIQNLLIATKHFAVKDVRGSRYLFQADTDI